MNIKRVVGKNVRRYRIEAKLSQKKLDPELTSACPKSRSAAIWCRTGMCRLLGAELLGYNE